MNEIAMTNTLYKNLVKEINTFLSEKIVAGINFQETIMLCLIFFMHNSFISLTNQPDIPKVLSPGQTATSAVSLTPRPTC